LPGDGPQGSDLDAHHSFSKAPRRLPEVRLVLLGERETGKSSAGNSILGKIGFFQVGEVTEECVRQQAEVAMRLVTLVDTPGWEGGGTGATPERVKREIVCSVTLCPPGPHALLLTLRADTLVRAGHIREHLELLGEGVWRYTILLFTHSDQLREGVNIEQHIQSGGRDLQWLLEKCRGRYHVISAGDGRGRGGATKVTELLEKVEKMATMNRCEAFSGLVQEVRDLSQQRNEKFSQRLKEIGDKMLRQEAELKKMRDREMKSIRWFFDRKKKVKSPGKADIQREEEEDDDRRVGETKNDIGELEERIRWLTEEREKEIQDLSLENQRIRVALNQNQQERHEAMLNLELKEREIEELKERTDEQQLKLLDLEHVCVESERERRQREDVFRLQTQEWRKKLQMLEETVELLKKEKAECIKELEHLKAELEQTKMHNEKSLERKEQEQKREMEEREEKLKREMEINLLERDKQLEELRKRASEEKQMVVDDAKQREKDTEKRSEEIKQQHKKEMERKVQEKEAQIKEHHEEMLRKISEQKQETDKLLKEKANESERMKEKHEDEKKKTQQEQERQITELKEQFAKEKKERLQEKEREMAEVERRYITQMEAKVLENEKDKETIRLNNKEEAEKLIQETEKETEALKLKHQVEMATKIDEMVGWLQLLRL